MIPLPDPERAFDHENAFHLTCAPSRVAKMIAHLDLYRRVLELPGAVVECGVFKGASLCVLAAYRSLLEPAAGRRLVGFDTFGSFPETDHPGDAAMRARFVDEAGDQSIGVEQLRRVLAGKGVDDEVELVPGDVRETVPAWCAQHPAERVALINLDTDLAEPARVVIDHLWPRLVPGGILMFDDYGVFPGETEAADALARREGLVIERLPYRATPAFVVKPPG